VQTSETVGGLMSSSGFLVFFVTFAILVAFVFESWFSVKVVVPRSST